MEEQEISLLYVTISGISFSFSQHAVGSILIKHTSTIPQCQTNSFQKLELIVDYKRRTSTSPQYVEVDILHIKY